MDKVIVGVAERRAYAETFLPDKARALWLKATGGECSPRQAIKAKCQQCVGYEDTVQRVRDCTTSKCPLWTFRPYQEMDAREDAINEGRKTE